MMQPSTALKWVTLRFSNEELERDDSCRHWLRQCEIALNTFLVSVGGLPQLFPLFANADNLADLLGQIRVGLENNGDG